MSCICCGKLRCDDHDDDSWQRCAERWRARALGPLTIDDAMVTRAMEAEVSEDRGRAGPDGPFFNDPARLRAALAAALGKP